MSGNKTHQQQRQILEKRVDTTNAGKDFDPRPDFRRAERGEAVDNAPPPPVRKPDDGDPALRGDRQESHHNRPKPEGPATR